MPKKPFSSPLLKKLESRAEAVAFADRSGASPEERSKLERLLTRHPLRDDKG